MNSEIPGTGEFRYSSRACTHIHSTSYHLRERRYSTCVAGLIHLNDIARRPAATGSSKHGQTSESGEFTGPGAVNLQTALPPAATASARTDPNAPHTPHSPVDTPFYRTCAPSVSTAPDIWYYLSVLWFTYSKLCTICEPRGRDLPTEAAIVFRTIIINCYHIAFYM